MRIKRLELNRFGPFNGQVLEFDRDRPDLHIILGANEAGKSSTLRALKAWLYGFPERTRDNFIHSNDQLLVSGVVQDQKKELFFARRKKRKHDLLDAHGNPMDPGKLKKLLQGIDHALFERLFGLDHGALVQGGTSILQEKGSAGTALFSAGTGIASLRQILSDLKSKSDGIYKNKASKPALNAALRSYNDLKSEISRLSLSSNEWKTHDRALNQALKKLESEQKKRRELSSEYNRLKRMQQALPSLGSRQELKRKLSEFKAVPSLPQNFAKQRAENQEKLRTARQTLAEARTRLQDLQQKAASISLNTELLDQSETIKALYQRLGEYRKGNKDLPVLDGKRVQEKTTAGNILAKIRADLDPDKAGQLRPLLGRRRGINDIGSRLPLLEQSLQTCRQKLQKLELEREKRERELTVLNSEFVHQGNARAADDLNQLKQAVDQAVRLGDIDTDLEDLVQRHESNISKFDAQTRQMGLWYGSALELLRLTLPLEESVTGFALRYKELAEKKREIEKEEKRLDKERKKRSKALTALEKSGEIPTEAELLALRNLRDQGWSLLKQKWVQGLEISAEADRYDPGLPLVEAYEQNVLQADNLADRLRREGKRVHEYAGITADLEVLKQESRELEGEKNFLEQSRNQLEKEWQRLWQNSGIAPLAPAEMSAWMSKIAQLRLQAGHIEEQKQEIENSRSKRLKAFENLKQTLSPFKVAPPDRKELGPPLKCAREVQELIEQNRKKRQTLEEKINTLAEEKNKTRVELEEAQTFHDRERQKWQEVLGELGLSGHETAGGVADFFEQLQACLDHLDRAGEFSKRMKGIRRDAQQFENEVSSLLQRVAPESAALPVDQALESVSALLSRTREDDVTLKTYQEGIAGAEKEIHKAEADMHSAHNELNQLCRRAGCEKQEELEDVEQRWEKKQDLNGRIREEEERLLQLAEGHSIADLQDQADQLDADGLPIRLEELEAELEGVNQNISELDQRVGEERTELQRMDGGALAAQKAEEAEEKLAEIRRLTDEYTLLRVSAKALENEIERFRRENQNPILNLAGDYFARLTLNSFQGMRTDIDDRGEPSIVGLRNEEERVTVDGLSSGTRDQLFMALRLASLEYRLEKNRPMPFIVDDVLINFDESRSEATLKALAGFGEKNQVLLFTHHSQIAQLAESKTQAKVHKLGSE
ncbi:MAG: AAA family ATPase [Desulfobacteraceae bacterium]